MLWLLSMYLDKVSDLLPLTQNLWKESMYRTGRSKLKSVFPHAVQSAMNLFHSEIFPEQPEMQQAQKKKHETLAVVEPVVLAM